MNKRARRTKIDVNMDREDILREELRDEVIRPPEKEHPVPMEVDGDPRQYETEELERQGYTEYGLENPPYENDEAPADEPEVDGKLAKHRYPGAGDRRE